MTGLFGGQHPFVKMQKYPGLHPDDTTVWNQFIKYNPTAFNSCDYNYRVGKGAEPLKNLPEKYAQLSRTITQLRIDVIGYTQKETKIIELKPINNLSALGQLIGYKKLYTDKNPTFRVPSCAIICFFSSDDLKYLFKFFKLEVIEVTPPDSYLF